MVTNFLNFTSASLSSGLAGKPGSGTAAGLLALMACNIDSLAVIFCFLGTIRENLIPVRPAFHVAGTRH
jgi:hypothetical protein